MRKIIFLDIDGTLISFNGSLSEKTREALKRAKEAGHTLMLCTGRTRCQIQEELLSEGLFDGMVAAAGAYIEYEGKEIYRKTIEPKLLERLVEFKAGECSVDFNGKGALIFVPRGLGSNKKLF